MITAHLPAGYLAHAALDRLGADRRLTLGVLLGSILPDLDMFWFALVDHGAVHHHTYLTHRPALWLLIAAVGLLLKQYWAVGIGLGGVLHVALDSIVGSIAWAWPVSDVSWPLVIVPATQDHWVMSFLFHWTFFLEIVLFCAAILVFLKRRQVQ